MSQPTQQAKVLALEVGCGFNRGFYNCFKERPMTSRRQRNTLDTAKFNAKSMAIIAVAALCMHAARSQTPPATAKPPMTAAVDGASSETARYMEAFARTDGKLSKEEAENLPAIAQRFEQIDGDQDGFISQAEYLDALKP
jgi:hypothetical protein